jgi:hypothetical protein
MRKKMSQKLSFECIAGSYFSGKQFFIIFCSPWIDTTLIWNIFIVANVLMKYSKTYFWLRREGLQWC